MRLFAAAATLVFAVLANVLPAGAVAGGPTITVQNVESRSSVNGCGRFRFDADIVTSNWPAGMPHVVKYHWARSGNHAWKMHTITLDASGKKHVRAVLNPIEARRGFAWVHIYAPVNFRSPRVGFSNPNC